MRLNIGKLEAKKVNARMRKPCAACGEMPEVVRLDITKGSGKWQKTTTLCVDCSEPWLEDLTGTLESLRDMMQTLLTIDQEVEEQK